MYRGVMERVRAYDPFARAFSREQSQNGDTAMIGTNTMSMIRRNGGKVAAMAVISLGFVLGGCNKDVKEENAKLTSENALLREQAAANTSEKAAMQAQLEAARTQQQAATPVVNNNSFSSDGGRYASSGRQHSGGETIITVAGDVLFLPGSATLKPEAKKELDGLVKTIKTQHSARSVRVEGYTDSDPIKKSKWASNEALSQARAETVRDYLMSKGVSSGRVTAMGMGSSKPKSSKKESRRVEVVIVEN